MRKHRLTLRGVLGLALIGLSIISVACVVTPASTLTVTPTPVPTPIPTVTPTPTRTLAPVPTPAPTATPVPAPAVRVIYAIPADREYHEPYSAAVNDATLDVQRWYAEQLGGYTFAIEGEIPQVCMLKSPAAYYEGLDGWDRVIEELQHCAPITFPSSRTVWAVYPDVAFGCDHSELGRGGYGVTILHRGDLDGLVNPSTYNHCGYGPRGEHGWVGGLAHELGHAFGLEHPPGCDEGLETCDEDTLMWAGYAYDFPDTRLTDIDIAILEASPFLQYNWAEKLVPEGTPDQHSSQRRNTSMNVTDYMEAHGCAIFCSPGAASAAQASHPSPSSSSRSSSRPKW